MGWGSDHLVQVSSPENVTVRVHLLILLFVSPRSEEGLRAKRAGEQAAPTGASVNRESATVPD